MTSADAAVVISAVAILVTIAIARAGWERDRRARNAEIRGRYVGHLIAMIESQSEPLLDPSWDGGRTMEGAAHHARAIAAMASLESNDRDVELTLFIAQQAYALGVESKAYRSSREAVEDAERNIFGARRSALLHARVLLTEELFKCQEGSIGRRRLKSFWACYCEALLHQHSLPDADEDR
ncbi:hypothetical protein Leucomu_05620 [Leucobacter muris]|uniref:DUF4129 domain-containing protein n=1 Tax=Leucobacter muris TaxID=1935379 RepID=A0ABX5QEG0_9MICO|nr:hypothetical protein [Leucobacter muris]QAB17466.1 hypothetical protein Leucomu_05620 [Leucobacter muris]